MTPTLALVLLWLIPAAIHGWDEKSIPMKLDDPRLKGMTRETIMKILNTLHKKSAKEVTMYMEKLKAYRKRFSKQAIAIKNKMDQLVNDVKLGIFIINSDVIDAGNKLHAEGKSGYKLALNAFSDQDNEAFTKQRCGRISASNKWNTTSVKNHGTGLPDVSPVYPGGKLKTKRGDEALPASFSWRGSGAVSPVKDQGTCGSCYAFSFVETLSGAYFLRYKKLMEFSQQYIVDCGTPFLNNGCDGGMVRNVMQLVIKNGIATAKDYPYTAKGGSCQKKPVQSLKAKLVKINSNERDLMQAIHTYGPVTAGMCASPPSFQHYSGGIYECTSAMDLDHEVTITGWGIDGRGNKYWEVKNTWGNRWGEDGFLKLNKDESLNCGITSDIYYIAFN